MSPQLLMPAIMNENASRTLVILLGLSISLIGLAGCRDSTRAPSDDTNSVVGKAIKFGEGDGSEQYRRNGWSHTEKEFTWTEGVSAQIAVPITPSSAGLKLKLTGSALIHEPDLPFQPVEVYANGQKIVEWQMSNLTEFVVRIPAEITKTGGTLLIEFRTPKAASPKSLGMSKDTRVLGICVHALELTG